MHHCGQLRYHRQSPRNSMPKLCHSFRPKHLPSIQDFERVRLRRNICLIHRHPCRTACAVQPCRRRLKGYGLLEIKGLVGIGGRIVVPEGKKEPAQTLQIKTVEKSVGTHTVSCIGRFTLLILRKKTVTDIQIITQESQKSKYL